MNQTTNSTINGVIRAGMATGGGIALSGQDYLLQLFGALATLLTVAWSIYEKVRAKSAKPGSGPTFPPPAAAVLLAGSLMAPALLTGCRTLTPDERLRLVRTVSTEVAYVGAAYDLEERPEHRAPYVAAVAALDALIARGTFNPVELRAALEAIPALHGSRGALLDAGVTLYVVGTGFIDIKEAPYVAAVATGVRDGLARALARHTGTALRALNPPLPKRCPLPPRPQ